MSSKGCDTLDSLLARAPPSQVRSRIAMRWNTRNPLWELINRIQRDGIDYNTLSDEDGKMESAMK